MKKHKLPFAGVFNSPLCAHKRDSRFFTIDCFSIFYAQKGLVLTSSVISKMNKVSVFDYMHYEAGARKTDLATHDSCFNTTYIRKNAATSGRFTVTGINTCGSGAPPVLSVTVNPLPDVAVTRIKSNRLIIGEQKGSALDQSLLLKTQEKPSISVIILPFLAKLTGFYRFFHCLSAIQFPKPITKRCRYALLPFVVITKNVRALCFTFTHLRKPQFI